MRITYYEKDGRIGVKYYHVDNGEEDFYPFALDLLDDFDAGLVPEEIQQAGKQAVVEHAKKMCQRDWKKRQKAVRDKIKAREERIDTMDIPISIEHSSGTTLHGRIIKNPNGHGIIVTLVAPFKSQKGYIFDYPNCFAEAMGGAKVYNNDGTLTKRAKRDANNAIIKLYEYGVRHQKHGDVLDIVESLNSAEEGGD